MAYWKSAAFCLCRRPTRTWHRCRCCTAPRVPPTARSARAGASFPLSRSARQAAGKQESERDDRSGKGRRIRDPVRDELLDALPCVRAYQACAAEPMRSAHRIDTPGMTSARGTPARSRKAAAAPATQASPEDRGLRRRAELPRQVVDARRAARIVRDAAPASRDRPPGHQRREPARGPVDTLRRGG